MSNLYQISFYLVLASLFLPPFLRNYTSYYVKEEEIEI